MKKDLIDAIDKGYVIVATKKKMMIIIGTYANYKVFIMIQCAH